MPRPIFGGNKKYIINSSSAELAQGVVKVNNLLMWVYTVRSDILIIREIQSKKIPVLTSYLSPTAGARLNTYLNRTVKTEIFNTYKCNPIYTVSSGKTHIHCYT